MSASAYCGTHVGGMDALMMLTPRHPAPTPSNDAAGLSTSGERAAPAGGRHVRALIPRDRRRPQRDMSSCAMPTPPWRPPTGVKSGETSGIGPHAQGREAIELFIRAKVVYVNHG